MFSQLFISSRRGDTLAFRHFRDDVTRATPQIFHKHMKRSTPSPPPLFHVDGVHFMYVVKGGVYFVGVTLNNIAPVHALEVLKRVAVLCKDYCGELSEAAIHSNFPLVHELLDEIIDFGYPQCTSAELLKDYIFNRPELLPCERGTKLFGAERRLATTSVPSVMTSSQNEVFVDVFEKLTILIGANGHVIQSEIHGRILAKTFVSSGHTDIRMGFNDYLRVSDGASSTRRDGVMLNEVIFGEGVNAEAFERDGSLWFRSTSGEFTVMKYHVTNNLHLPVRVHSILENLASNDLCLHLKMTCHIPRGANKIKVCVPVPKTTMRLINQIPLNNSSVELKDAMVTWYIEKLPGESECQCRLKIILSDATATCRKEVGPLAIEFEIPSYSQVNVKYLKLTSQRGHKLKQWIRYITHTDSYVVRVT